MPVIRTNLQVIRPSRDSPEVGDIYVMRLPDATFLFGRVIGANLDREHAPMPGSYLIYIYAARSATPVPDVRALTPMNLLIPPLFINKMPWTRGYFAKVENSRLTSKDLLEEHSFWSAGRQHYRDLDGNVLTRPTHMSGQFALMSYRMLDDMVSDAVGLPRVPIDS